MGWATGPAALLAHAISWWAACAVIVVAFGTLAYQVLAERERRKTLEAAYLHAPRGTIVVQGEGPGGPPMWIRIGDGPPAEQPVPRPPVWVQVVPRRWRPLS
jgi:hypothetical protein